MSEDKAGQDHRPNQPIPIRPWPTTEQARVEQAQARLRSIVKDVRARAEIEHADLEWVAVQEVIEDQPPPLIPGIGSSISRIRARLRACIPTRSRG